MGNDSSAKFTFWDSYLIAARKMNDEDRLSFLDALIAYGIEGEIPEMTPIADLAFGLVRPSIDKTANRSKVNAENARSGRVKVAKRDAERTEDFAEQDVKRNEAVAEQDVKRNETVAERDGSGRSQSLIDIDIDSDSDIDGDGDIDGGSKGGEAPQTPHMSRRFTPPTEEEADAYGDEYAQRKGYPPGSFDAESFMGFYESKGWKVGRVPMKDWKAAIRNSVLQGWTVSKGRASPVHQPSAAALAARRKNETLTEF